MLKILEKEERKMYNKLYSSKGADKMNGENLNNNFNNNKFGGMSLGAINNGGANNSDNIESLGPIPDIPSPTIQNESTGGTNIAPQPISSQPVAVPIPGTENINQNVGSSKKFQSIGKSPDEKEKEKKPVNKIVFIIIIVVLIIGVAVGIYYFLKLANSKVKLTPITLNLGIGETLPDDIKSYVKVNSGDVSTCSLNTRNVDLSVSGEYKVTITCGNDEYISKVIVSDTTPPELSLKYVFKTVGSYVTVDEFIKDCHDESNSECLFSFVDSESVNSSLLTAGSKEVEIEAEDASGNKVVQKTNLYVTNEAVSVFAIFSSNEEVINELNVKKVVMDVFPLNTTLTFLGVARRDYKFVFIDKDSYENVTKDKKSVITFNDITGFAKYDDKNMTLEISTDLSIDTLNSENNGSFPTSYVDIQNIYKNEKDYLPSFLGYDIYLNGNEN